MQDNKKSTKTANHMMISCRKITNMSLEMPCKWSVWDSKAEEGLSK